MSTKLRYQFEDFLSGRCVWDNYVFLKDSQNWDKNRMEEYRLKKLINLLNFCYRSVPAYSYLMKQSGLHPDNIGYLDSIKQLPVINKQYILDHYTDFIPSAQSSVKGVKFGRTSGTTGQVLRYMNDTNSRSMVWGSFLRFQDWMGRYPDQLFIVFRGRNILKESALSKLKNHLTDVIENAKTFDSYKLGEKEINNLIRTLDKNPKAILRGYVLNLVDIAGLLKREGLSYSLQAVTTTAEPLLAFHRKAIKDTFNCEIFDQYGCGEIGGVAYECSNHQGMHITEEHVILETDENDEIILTDLDNYAFPFIRYKNGDQVLLDEKPCECARNSKLIKTVLGRTSDNIIALNGLPVHWGYFHHLIIYTNIAVRCNLKKFQVIQNKLDEIIINFQSDPLLQTEKDTLRSILKDKLGEINIIINNVNEIPNSDSGKFKAIVSKMNLK
jgi:phenylacetate-CoA ligase